MNNTMNIIRKVQFDFDNEALEVLKANEEWSEYQRNKEALQKELESKLEKIHPKLRSELRKLEDLYTSLECVELEIYFAKGFKEGVKFLKDCL
jgi:hypothetical protein